MDLSPRNILVPLAGARTADGTAIIDVRVADEPPAHNRAGLDAQIAMLGDWGGLYQSAMTACAAVRRLRLRPVGVGRLRAWRGSPLPGYVSIPNATALDGLDPSQSRSAELGIALALVAYGGQARPDVIFATGQLESRARPSAEDRNVRVEPVAEIATKLAEIRQYTETASIERGSRILLFLPAETIDGRDTRAAHRDELGRLAEAVSAKAGTLDIHPVATLNDAVVTLGIRGIEPTRADKVLAASAAVAATAAVLSIAWSLWLSAPIGIAFAEVMLSDGSRVSSPLRAVYEPQSAAYVMQPECLGPQAMPHYRNGDGLVLRTVIRDQGVLVNVLGGYHHILVAVSERSDVVVVPPQSFARPLPSRSGAQTFTPPPPGKWDVSVAVPIEGIPERTKLFVLAKRGRPFDADALATSTRNAIANAKGVDRLNVATTHLSRIASYVDYTFRSTEGDVSCAP